MEKWYKTFISSTKDDLIDERNAVRETLLKMNCIPIGMELFPSTGEGQWDIIKRNIEQCDYFIIILAGCYGSINTTGVGGENYFGMSFTEMEYRYAYELNKPIIPLIYFDNNKLPHGKVDTDPLKSRKLSNLRSEIMSHREVQLWDSKQDLCLLLSTSLHTAFKVTPRPGLAPPHVYEEVQKDLIADNDLLRFHLKREQNRVKKLQLEIVELLSEASYINQSKNLIYVYSKDHDKFFIERTATALDFAFKIHPLVGLCTREIHVMSQHKQSFKLVQFRYNLKLGDTIQVITDSGKNGKQLQIHATKKWFNYLHTSSAMQILKKYLSQPQLYV